MSNPSNNEKTRFVASVMQFLTEELKNEELSLESKDSIEVAIQCLETAYNINPVDGTLPSKKPLLEIFSTHLKDEKEEAPKTISDTDKSNADEFKNKGNELMKNGNFQEALEAYTKAIEIYESNPIYFCNRAAAHSKLGNHQEALDDCKIAIQHDPNYSKAYCRMGLAYGNLNDHQRARDSYKKAFELDPSENNQNNLKLAEQRLQEQQAQFNSGFNFGNVLNNPQIMNIANQLMSDPNMQNMLSNIMSTTMGPQANPEGEAPPSGETESSPFEAFLQAGQQFAAQMQAANPELVEQLKNAYKKTDGSEEKEPPK